MHASHAIAAGMGGMRTAGDLVGRMQVTRGMRLGEAKDYVAGKLGIGRLDLCDPVVMREVRRELKLGFLVVDELAFPDEPGAIEAKFHIAEVLDVPINCVERFRKRVGSLLTAPAGV
jgi:dimethylamine--corrinoid protein Co-methyltransferase